MLDFLAERNNSGEGYLSSKASEVFTVILEKIPRYSGNEILRTAVSLLT